ncbi:hypothetical protein T439DRAFT_107341 [Meredithblackwellia eburnea MCA 4105]
MIVGQDPSAHSPTRLALPSPALILPATGSHDSDSNSQNGSTSATSIEPQQGSNLSSSSSDGDALEQPVVVIQFPSRAVVPEPTKRGEFGWDDVVHAEQVHSHSPNGTPGRRSWRASITAAMSSPRPPSFSTIPPSNESKKRRLHPLDFTGRLAPGVGRLLGFLAAALGLAGVVAGMVIVLPGLQNGDSTSSENGNSTLPNGNGTDSQQPPSTQQPMGSGFSVTLFILMLFILALLAALVFTYSRARALYIFHRRRYLLIHTPFPDPLAPTSSPASILRAYHHSRTFLTSFTEVFLRTPLPVLLPSIFASLPISHSSTMSPATRNSNPLVTPWDNESVLATTDPEDEPDQAAISRAQREGAAPMYGSGEMRRSLVLLRGRKVRPGGLGGIGVSRDEVEAQVGGGSRGVAVGIVEAWLGRERAQERGDEEEEERESIGRAFVLRGERNA